MSIKPKYVLINHLSNAFWLYSKVHSFRTAPFDFSNVSNGTPCITNFKLFEITSISKETNFLEIAPF